ncbi:hypothetical protein [Shewanella dokdonensis]|uniref:DUF4178 domain-containing protein n=1 Tax=Shewanella dokdonensis TaxID=712036 RepID=A0ABX8DFS4_9GAMM|nr:hypothetical protein [Shewanella dokdonensis]MCL1075209.1 hypothetical protein [Shewanella dokdonensis]QVK23584.1 hypothetical protein KHX94_02195 [Shewanella dokdonensis]
MGLLLDIQNKVPLQLQGLSKLSGLSALEKRRRLQQGHHHERQFVGCWRDPRQQVNDEIQLFRDNGKWFMETWFSDGCHSLDEMAVTDTAEGLRLEEAEGNLFGEYLLLQDANILAFCSDNGGRYLAEKLSA